MPSVDISRKGIYHKVGKGETIWRIAQQYGVKLENIIESNNIPNIAKVEVNQLIFIPGVDEVLEIEPVLDRGNENEFGWPVQGKIISYFDGRNQQNLDNGIGIQVPAGQSVSAARSGKVVFADYLSGYAFTVILDHQDGYASVYAQNSKLMVRLGDLVLKGDPVSEVANLGEHSHLYFEIRRNAIADNPLYYLPQTK